MTLHPPILIADDDPTIRHFLVRIVQKITRQALIVEASDGRAALQALTQHQFDLVITDYNMPHATGLDVLRAVRAQSQTTPVIIISARASVGTAALAAGASGFLTKPFTADDLTRLIRQVLP